MQGGRQSACNLRSNKNQPLFSLGAVRYVWMLKPFHPSPQCDLADEIRTVAEQVSSCLGRIKIVWQQQRDETESTLFVSSWRAETAPLERRRRLVLLAGRNSHHRLR